MTHSIELIENDIQSYLKEHEQKTLLRILTCGSVDDGKSTLIGRLLHDSKLIFEDQLSAIKNTHNPPKLVRCEKQTCTQAKTLVQFEAHKPNRICAQPFRAQPPRTSIHAGCTTAHKPCAQSFCAMIPSQNESPSTLILHRGAHLPGAPRLRPLLNYHCPVVL